MEKVTELPENAEMELNNSAASIIYRSNCGSMTSSYQGGYGIDPDLLPFHFYDFYHNGGSEAFTPTRINTTGITNPAPGKVLQSERYGLFYYEYPWLRVGGTYGVRLHFAETSMTAEEERQFIVKINGVFVLTNFDIFAEAGAYQAVIKEFTTIADDSGHIQIEFLPGTAGIPTCRAIEVIDVSPSPSIVTAPIPCFHYWDASSAVNNYPKFIQMPKFNYTVPPLVENLGSGREYPVIDAHIHTTNNVTPIDIQTTAGIYATVILREHKGPFAIQSRPDFINHLFPEEKYLSGSKLDGAAMKKILQGLAQDKTDGYTGLKFLHSWGVNTKDYYGNVIYPDDGRLIPVWQFCADNKWTVVMGAQAPGIRSGGTPGSEAAMNRTLNCVKNNPNVVFVIPHFGDLDWQEYELFILGNILETVPNYYVDTSGRSYLISTYDQKVVRDFIIKYQDKILWGTDAEDDRSPTDYFDDFAYYETSKVSTYFYKNAPPQKGLGLPADVLKKIYYQNALKVYYWISHKIDTVKRSKSPIDRELVDLKKSKR